MLLQPFENRASRNAANLAVKDAPTGIFYCAPNDRQGTPGRVSLARLKLSIAPIMLACAATTALSLSPAYGQESRGSGDADTAAVRAQKQSFQKQIQPLLQKYCLRCHNADDMESGIRVDQLNGAAEDRHLFLWKDILKQVAAGTMPPEDESQPTDRQRQVLTEWIRAAMTAARARAQKNGSVRRLTVSQYRNTLRDLLELEEDLTHVLPPDAVSREGFTNNAQSMVLSPLQVEAYFNIAEKALGLSIVDETSRPVIQNFRMDLGAAINSEPCPDKLILGANSRLLANSDFIVTQLTPVKPFEFEPFRMQTSYEFIEGYQGNATVRGWRKYDSIYHAVFACMRGNPGYPKGSAYETVPEGLLLRPAIPSAELFGVESTYGPQANFKISLRELPDHGNFRVKVKAARYDDGLVLDPGAETQVESTSGGVTVTDVSQPRTVNIDKAGIYQADVYFRSADDSIPPDASKLQEGLIGAWSLNGNTHGESGREELSGRLEGDARFVDSPFGQALSVDGDGDSAVVNRNDLMNVGEGEFTVTAWIHPRELRQGGIVCLGKYSWTHGWYFDMPNNRGVLRIETAGPDNQSNGTVASPPGTIRVNSWQHVAAVVRRGPDQTRLYVNGFQVATGTIEPADLDNAAVDLHIGRIQDSRLFKGEIDEVRIYRRALDVAEIHALLQPGRQFVRPPAPEKPQNLTLQLGRRHFTGILHQPAFLTVRLPAGPLTVTARYAGQAPLHRVVLTPLDKEHEVAKRFEVFEKRSPRLGVYVGLRRDCGSTLNPVGTPQVVASSEAGEFVFQGAINNFPRPDVEQGNVNYLAGIREIGVRSEYTDGRDMPRLQIQSVEFEGPWYETWPPAAHRRIFRNSGSNDNPVASAKAVLGAFAERAFRRPVTDAEAAAIFAVWNSSFAESGDFHQSLRDALLVVLTSPQFLFLIEHSSGPEPESLDDRELAAKLAYFLWNAPPDEQLLKVAATGTLQESPDAEIDRMLRDPRCQEFVHEFTSQWLSLQKLDVLEVDRSRYPRLTRKTRTHLRNEPVRYVQYLIDNNLPLRNLIQSDFIVANEVVAAYYNLGDRTESGFQFVPIRRETTSLGGILTQAGILAGLSDGRESNPVKRGAWLARRIIAEPPDDPPPNVPALPEEDNSQRTLRERLERHRNQKGCADCHAGIDPWGIPFEQFDAGGLWKHDATVDARSTLPDGTEIEDLEKLKTYLAGDRIDQVAFSFLKHLASYAVGRSLSYNEIVFLREEGIKLKSTGYRMQDMIRFVIKSDLFLQK